MTLRADLVPAEHGTKMDLVHKRQAEPSLDDSLFQRIEMEFAIPVYVTADQMEMLHYIMKEICADPQNTPVGAQHAITSQGPKPLFSLTEVDINSGEKTIIQGSEKLWDEETLYFRSSVI